MKNLTNYSNEFIEHLINIAGGDKNKCTVNVQLVNNNLIPTLNIYQEVSLDWDYAYKRIFSVPVEELDYLGALEEIMELWKDCCDLFYNDLVQEELDHIEDIIDNYLNY